MLTETFAGKVVRKRPTSAVVPDESDGDLPAAPTHGGRCCVDPEPRRAHAVREAFCPHQLLPLGDDRHVDARFHAVRFGRIGLHYLDYGTGVRIAPRALTDFYLLQIPLAGEAVIRRRGQEIRSHPGMGSMPSPDDDLVMHWCENNPQLIVWIDRAQMEGHLSTMLNRPLTKPIGFELGGGHRRSRGPRAAARGGAAARRPRRRGRRRGRADRRGRRRAAADEPAPAGPTEQLHGPAAPRSPRVAPRPIRRAADLIEAHAAEPLGVEDIAEAVGLSVRALQEGFRGHLDTTPMNHLREVRLRLVRDELTAADRPPSPTSP